MTYDALRKGRASLPGYAYVVTTVTSHRRPYFFDLTAARTVIREMRRLEEEGAIRSLAWVLMPDHLHWLLQLSGAEKLTSAATFHPNRPTHEHSLATVMRLFKGRSARALNSLLHRKGRVWQRAYYDRGVRENEDVRQIAHYIAANPLRAGLARSLADYPHWDSVWLENA